MSDTSPTSPPPMPNDVPDGYYDGPVTSGADAVVERARGMLAGRPPAEVFRTLDEGLRAAGVEPRLDAVEILSREIAGGAGSE